MGMRYWKPATPAWCYSHDPMPALHVRARSLGFEVENLEIAIERLTQAGSQVSLPKHEPEGFREVVTHDPDGNKVRLFVWPTL